MLIIAGIIIYKKRFADFSPSFNIFRKAVGRSIQISGRCIYQTSGTFLFVAETSSHCTQSHQHVILWFYFGRGTSCIRISICIYPYLWIMLFHFLCHLVYKTDNCSGISTTFLFVYLAAILTKTRSAPVILRNRDNACIRFICKPFEHTFNCQFQYFRIGKTQLLIWYSNTLFVHCIILRMLVKIFFRWNKLFKCMATFPFTVSYTTAYIFR